MVKRHRLAAGVTLVTAALVVSGWLAWRRVPEPAVARAEGGVGGAPQEADTAAGGQQPTAAEVAILAHQNATRGPEQPIPFNHAFHVTELTVSCNYCHTGTDRSQVAIMPALSVCIGCHRVVGGGLAPIQELRAYAARGETVPWERVYKLPEFVQFYHAPHIRNGIGCEECHGPVEEMDRIYQWSSLRMGWCLECHRGAVQDSDVATDYLLAQEFEPPTLPAGRQSTGMYPIRISEEYAEHRAPIDCLACHY